MSHTQDDEEKKKRTDEELPITQPEPVEQPTVEPEKPEPVQPQPELEPKQPDRSEELRARLKELDQHISRIDNQLMGGAKTIGGKLGEGFRGAGFAASDILTGGDVRKELQDIKSKMLDEKTKIQERLNEIVSGKAAVQPGKSTEEVIRGEIAEIDSGVDSLFSELATAKDEGVKQQIRADLTKRMERRSSLVQSLALNPSVFTLNELNTHLNKELAGVYDSLKQLYTLTGKDADNLEDRLDAQLRGLKNLAKVLGPDSQQDEFSVQELRSIQQRFGAIEQIRDAINLQRRFFVNPDTGQSELPPDVFREPSEIVADYMETGKFDPLDIYTPSLRRRIAAEAEFSSNDRIFTAVDREAEAVRLAAVRSIFGVEPVKQSTRGFVSEKTGDATKTKPQIMREVLNDLPIGVATRLGIDKKNGTIPGEVAADLASAVDDLIPIVGKMGTGMSLPNGIMHVMTELKKSAAQRGDTDTEAIDGLSKTLEIVSQLKEEHLKRAEELSQEGEFWSIANIMILLLATLGGSPIGGLAAVLKRTGRAKEEASAERIKAGEIALQGEALKRAIPEEREQRRLASARLEADILEKKVLAADRLTELLLGRSSRTDKEMAKAALEIQKTGLEIQKLKADIAGIPGEQSKRLQETIGEMIRNASNLQAAIALSKKTPEIEKAEAALANFMAIMAGIQGESALQNIGGVKK